MFGDRLRRVWIAVALLERTVMAKLLLGKPVIDSLREELKGRIAALEERGVKPGLAIVRVGARPDDLAYERTALKRAAGLGGVHGQRSRICSLHGCRLH